MNSTYRTTLQERNHALAEETLWIPHLKQISICRLRKNTEIDCCHVLVSCVDYGTSVLHEFEASEFLERLFAKLVFNLFFGPLAFLFDVEAAEVNVVFCLPACEASDTSED
jgi:hypothetical protein